MPGEQTYHTVVHYEDGTDRLIYTSTAGGPGSIAPWVKDTDPRADEIVNIESTLCSDGR